MRRGGSCKPSWRPKDGKWPRRRTERPASRRPRRIRPALIVLDVQMPEKDGFVMFADLIKDPDTKDIKVIMLTGVADKVGIRFSGEEMGDFLGKEPDAYVEKPIDPEAFKRVVRRVMGEK